MESDLNEIFVSALNYFYRKYKTRGGTQSKLAKRLGITQSYVSAVLNGSKSASLELQNQMAHFLYGPYEEFLAIGRRIKNGLDPELYIRGDEEGVESLIARLSHYVVDHQRIEKELLESRAKLRDIILTGSDMIFEMGPDMKFTFLEGKVEETMGRDREEMLGRNPLEYLDDTERARVQALIDESVADHSILECSMTVPHGNVKVFRQVTAKPIYDENGSFAGFRGTCRDITGQVQLKERLEHETWLLKAAMETVGWVGIVILDKSNRIIQYNSVYQKMFDIPDNLIRENDPRKTLGWIKNKVKAPEDFMEKSLKVLTSREKSVQEFELQDGRFIRRVVLPLMRDGDVGGREVIVYDITDEVGKQGPEAGNVRK